MVAFAWGIGFWSRGHLEQAFRGVVRQDPVGANGVSSSSLEQLRYTALRI